VKGPASTLYLSEAVGGLNQLVITKKNPLSATNFFRGWILRQSWGETQFSILGFAPKMGFLQVPIIDWTFSGFLLRQSCATIMEMAFTSFDFSRREFSLFQKNFK